MGGKAGFKHLRAFGCSLVSIFVFLIIWQVLVQWNVKVPLLFGNIPSPLAVLSAVLTALKGVTFYQDIGFSSIRVLAGCGIAFPLAVGFGLLIGLSWFGRYFLLPIFNLLRPIPQIAWVPISILLFSSVEGSIIFITFLGAFFPILINTIAGTEAVSHLLLDAAKSMNATKLQQVVHVYIPSAIPYIITGLTVGIGNSWISVIAAEMISGKFGIGYFTWTSYTLMQYPNIIVGMISIGAVGSLFFGLVRLLEKWVVRWR